MAEAHENPVILFDGVCNLCEGVVKFVIARDPHARFRFASLQSEAGQQLSRDHELPTEDWKTFVVIDGASLYLRSDVVLRIAADLSGPWGGLKILHLVPHKLRDWLYARIVANRYRIFGRKDECLVPTDAIRKRFLS